MLVFPPFRLDLEEGRLWKGDTLLTIRRKPLAILRYLVQHPRRLVTQEELLSEVWSGTVVSDSSLRSHVHELRQVLGEGVIETVIGQGYRFMADVAELARVPEPVSVDPYLVGREKELQSLRGAFARASTGRRQVCFVTGDPGIGKSTLVRMFLAELDSTTVWTGQGACFEQHGTPEPYLALIEALGGLLHSPHGPKVLAALVRHAPTFLAQVPHWITEEQHIDLARRASGGNEARQLRELCEAIEAMCAQQVLVLALEDLQWSDVATIDLLSLLGQRSSHARLLVIGTSRHSEIQTAQHPLNRVLRSLVVRSGAVEIQVSRMDRDTVQTFLDHRFPENDFPPAFTELVAKITGGTPLFMVSLLDELVGRDMVSRHGNTWELKASIEDVQAHRPASIKQLIDLQLDRLSPLEQRVLEAAGVVGCEFSTHLVAAALERSEEEVDDVCDSLVRRSLFLRPEPDGRYGVTHALIQEVCVQRSSPVRRQRWHRLVAEALERNPNRQEIAHLLAKHFDAAGDTTRAVSSYAEAGRLAAQRFASSDAVTLCARALDLIPRVPPGPQRDLLELQILETMCREVTSNTFSAVFAGREAHAVYGRAIEIARALGDVPKLYGAITQLCNYNMIVARYDESRELTDELERIEELHELEPRSLHAGIFTRGYVAFFRADFQSALRHFQRLLPDPGDQTSPFHGLEVGRALALGHLACVHWAMGESNLALDEANETIALAERIESPIMQALGHVVRGRLRFLRRDPLEIVEAEAPVAVRAASLDVGLWTEASAFALWAQARRSPQPMEAIEPLLTGLQQRLREVSTCSTLVALVLAETLRLSGHTAEALDLTDEIILFARAHNESVYLPELLMMRGDLRQVRDPKHAANDYREAAALARAQGGRNLVPPPIETPTPTKARTKHSA